MQFEIRSLKAANFQPESLTFIDSIENKENGTVKRFFKLKWAEQKHSGKLHNFLSQARRRILLRPKGKERTFWITTKDGKIDHVGCHCWSKTETSKEKKHLDNSKIVYASKHLDGNSLILYVSDSSFHLSLEQPEGEFDSKIFSV